MDIPHFCGQWGGLSRQVQLYSGPCDLTPPPLFFYSPSIFKSTHQYHQSYILSINTPYFKTTFNLRTNLLLPEWMVLKCRDHCRHTDLRINTYLRKRNITAVINRALTLCSLACVCIFYLLVDSCIIYTEISIAVKTGFHRSKDIGYISKYYYKIGCYCL